MTFSIGVLVEGHEGASLITSLPHLFPNQPIIAMGQRDLHNTALLNTIGLLALPGITGEESHYDKIYTPALRDTLHHAVTSMGLMLWLECSHGYYFADKIIYGDRVYQGLGFFNAEARGPVTGDKGRRKDPHDPTQQALTETIVLPVTYGKDNTPGGVCCSNGPALYPHDALEEGRLEVFARYAHLTDKPIAIAHKRIGKGLVTFNGVLPQITHEMTQLPEKTLRQLPHLRRLNTALARHEASRKDIMDRLVQRYHAHYAQLHHS